MSLLFTIVITIVFLYVSCRRTDSPRIRSDLIDVEVYYICRDKDSLFIVVVGSGFVLSGLLRFGIIFTVPRAGSSPDFRV